MGQVGQGDGRCENQWQADRHYVIRNRLPHCAGPWTAWCTVAGRRHAWPGATVQATQRSPTRAAHLPIWLQDCAAQPLPWKLEGSWAQGTAPLVGLPACGGCWLTNARMLVTRGIPGCAATATDPTVAEYPRSTVAYTAAGEGHRQSERGGGEYASAEWRGVACTFAHTLHIRTSRDIAARRCPPIPAQAGAGLLPAPLLSGFRVVQVDSLLSTKACSVPLAEAGGSAAREAVTGLKAAALVSAAATFGGH